MLEGATGDGLEKLTRWRGHPAAKTPMMEQFFAAKEQHPDAIVFFRMGDFYETFFDDAVDAARLLELTLTSRNKKDPEPVPMAGVPHHAAPGYIRRLLEAGRKVAVCEQVENPKETKGLVRREVVRVVTPGVVLDAHALDGHANNFLASLVAQPFHQNDKPHGAAFVAWVDASTGEVRGSQLESYDAAIDELARLEPAELVVPVDALESTLATSRERLGDLPISTVPSEGIEPTLEGARDVLGRYIQITQKDRVLPLRPMETVDAGGRMGLSATTVRNLELCRTLVDHSKTGSLLHLLNRTRTAMGSRMLKQWMLNPLLDPLEINARLDALEALHSDVIIRDGVRHALAAVYDLERLLTRVVAQTASPRDLVALASSLESVPNVREQLEQATSPALRKLAVGLDHVPEVIADIRAALVDDPPITLKDGGVIREGHDGGLDELLVIAREGKDWFAAYAESLREQTSIGSLKIRYNSVFGYFIEVTKANLHLVPDTWLRKQTLANAERYYTAELKEREERVLGADERRLVLETALFERIRSKTATYGERIQQCAGKIAAIDVVAGLAELAHIRGYCRPTVDASGQLRLRQARHPVIESLMPRGEFVPNDIVMDIESQQLLIITGPNMAGKSTVMRQTALIAIMAQMGSFVPASEAHIGVVDQVFTRVGASDNLARGQSTFMVEMTEASHILRRASRRSLIVIDEIGRGTSTYDGVSIAWSIAEYLHDEIGARTLFATHYHELTDLAATRDRVTNLHIAVKEWQNDIVFLRRLEVGGTNRSYGIQVARLAGLPDDVVDRAKEVLHNLEDQQLTPDSRPRLSQGAKSSESPWQLNLFAPPVSQSLLDTIARLKKLDVDSLSPREALNILYELRDSASQ